MRAARVALALALGCSASPRPVGLPPPEYQVPQVEPWPAASASPPAPPVDPPRAIAIEAAVGGVAGAAGAPTEGSGGSGATLPPGTP